MNTAAVIGLGLIGGSVAREFAAQGIRVLGFDRDAEQLQEGLREGVIAEALSSDFGGVRQAEAVVVAVPPGAVPEVLRALTPHLDRARLVTDAGSTKGSAIAAAAALGIGHQFVGSHPLAGDHRSGWAASRLGMFRGARVYLCPTKETGETTFAAAHEMWASFGGHAEVLDAEEHDRRLAWTSHLPQVLSSVLAVALARSGVDPRDLGPGGRDMTRLAGSSAELWADIALDNLAELLTACQALQSCWRELEEALASGNRARVQQLLATGNRWVQNSRA